MCLSTAICLYFEKYFLLGLVVVVNGQLSAEYRVYCMKANKFMEQPVFVSLKDGPVSIDAFAAMLMMDSNGIPREYFVRALDQSLHGSDRTGTRLKVLF